MLGEALQQCHFDTMCALEDKQRPTVWDLLHMAAEVLGLYDHL